MELEEARRNLFENMDQERVVICMQAIQQETELLCKQNLRLMEKKYNYDFENDRPITGTLDSKFKWSPIKPIIF